MNSKLKRYFQFLLVVLAAGAIFPIMYLKTNYQETILEVFNISLIQLNTIYSFLGIVWVVGYLPSGLISDRFSAKKLLSISLFGTAAGGFWFAQIPSHTFVIVIFCIWGVFSVFTFWSAHMKLVKLLAQKEEQGRFFGILDGGRGVVEALLASFALLIFSGILGDSTDLADKRSAMVAIIYMYSIVLVVIGIFVTVFVREDRKAAATGDAKAVAQSGIKLADLGQVFKNKFVYLMGGIIFLSYSVTWTVYYYGGFLQTNIGVDPVTVASIMVIVLWMRPIGGIGGGFLADKFGRGPIVMSALLATTVCLILMAILPPDSGISLFYVLVVAAGLFQYAIRGTYWSLIGEYKIDNAIVGSAIGFISLVGYLPDIILGPFNSVLFNTFGDNGGYNAYFIASAIFGIVGALLVLTFIRLTKKEKLHEEGKAS
ncbi:MAG TPA: MFS transporter [Syntrophomonas sp.]|nr:MFS transporter [Syntrophomonas sp.]